MPVSHVIHVRRLNIPIMLCGLREFEPGVTKRFGTYNVSRANCDACLVKHKERVAKAMKGPIVPTPLG